MGYLISADSDSEILYQWEDRYDIRVLRMPYTIDGQELYYDLGRDTDIKAFYKKMREGALVTTAQRNPQEFKEFWTPILEEGHDILHISFSSALSGTFGCGQIARTELLEKYPDRRIEMVDTLAISMPAGLLVKRAAEMKEAGAGITEVRDWVEENKQRANALFTVDDLIYLKRGGRVSGAAAFFLAT